MYLLTTSLIPGPADFTRELREQDGDPAKLSAFTDIHGYRQDIRYTCQYERDYCSNS